MSERFSMADVRAMMQRAGVPGGDRYDLPASPHTFPDGAHYRHEASGISTPELLETLIAESRKRGVPVHRVIFGMRGSADRLTLSELTEVAHIAAEGGIELVIETGISSKSDIGSHVHTENGRIAGLRPRGSDQLAYQLANVLRCIEAGIRGFLLRCEGSMMLMQRLREAGDIPERTVFKLSYDTGHANPAGAMLIEQLGADSFNPPTDLELPMLAAMRQVIRIPMDLVVHSWPGLGGIKRHWQSPHLVRVAAPVYLKQELFEQPVVQARNCELIAEIMQRTDPALVCSSAGTGDLCIPVRG